MQTERLISALYPEVSSRLLRRPGKADKRETAAGRLGFKLGEWTRRRNRRIIFAVLIITAWAAAHIYYFNLITLLECRTQEAWSNVEIQLQRRYYMQRNLTRIVIDYARYEEQLMTKLTDMRTRPKGAESGESTSPSVEVSPSQPEGLDTPSSLIVDQLSPPDLNKLFSKMQVVAEQYPELKLTQNFQQLSAAIIEINKDIAKVLTDYNVAAGHYCCEIETFPGRWFNLLYGFKIYPFFKGNPEDLSFKEVEF
jgi:LemA protein